MISDKEKQEKRDWMESLIMRNVPGWLMQERKPFEYNAVYEFWRASYPVGLRQKITDFELLKAHLPLPPRHNLAICGQNIYIRSDHYEKHIECQYEQLIRAVPMQSPVEPEAIWKLISESSKTSYIGCSFGHIAKSHAVRSFNEDGLTTLMSLFDEELGHQGYSTAMFVKTTGSKPEYLVSITHTSESFGAFVAAIKADGFTQCAGVMEVEMKAAPLSLDDELALQEASLLEQLVAVRAQRAALLEDPNYGEQ